MQRKLLSFMFSANSRVARSAVLPLKPFSPVRGISTPALLGTLPAKNRLKAIMPPRFLSTKATFSETTNPPGKSALFKPYNEKLSLKEIAEYASLLNILFPNDHERRDYYLSWPKRDGHKRYDYAYITRQIAISEFGPKGNTEKDIGVAAELASIAGSYDAFQGAMAFSLLAFDLAKNNASREDLLAAKECIDKARTLINDDKKFMHPALIFNLTKTKIDELLSQQQLTPGKP